jgi:hypothetical protein
MKKPYRSIEFNDERKWKATHALDDLLQVGNQKALGYICSWKGETFKENVYGQDIKALKRSLAKSGKLVSLRKKHDGKCLVLWAGDKKMIQKILNRHKSLLKKSRWTADAKEFFKRISRTDVAHDQNEELYHLVAKLFNSWCLWCEKPIWVKGRKEPLSENPYDPDSDNG